jgi:hypothetical protein
MGGLAYFGVAWRPDLLEHIALADDTIVVTGRHGVVCELSG